MLLAAYKGSRNLGDAIQTIALAQWVKVTGYVFRNEWSDLTDFNELLVLNGFLCDPPPTLGHNVLAAGVFISNQANINWIKNTWYPIGCRDPWTQAQLTKQGIKSEMIGCATCTFPTYRGSRSGVYRVDVEDSTDTHEIPTDLDWDSQLDLANAKLRKYESAELVITSRLHVALPCLAFGTPVIVKKPPKSELPRFSVLEKIGLKFGQKTIIDMAPCRRRYLNFLERYL